MTGSDRHWGVGGDAHRNAARRRVRSERDAPPESPVFPNQQVPHASVERGQGPRATVPPRSEAPRHRVHPPHRTETAGSSTHARRRRLLPRLVVIPGRVGEAQVYAAGDRTSRKGRRSRRSGYRRMLIRRWAVAVLSLLVFTVTGYGWSQYHDLMKGIGRSEAIRGDTPKSADGDTNTLIMGLDSRLDENGNPLPPQIYQALHAGDQQAGGYNANVLMLVHLPGNGARATAISIPRDDYVSLPGSPDGIAKGKIKQAYGFAFDQKYNELVAAGMTNRSSLEQQSRDAGRREELTTVSRFLGDVPIDHFVEVTLVGFYQLTQIVAPITVCLTQDTSDSYSGADFHRGYQQITATQAVAFVRQRRDTAHPQRNFTDLDRERRQQAFIASLAYQLRQAGTFFNPGRLHALVTVAKQNIVADINLEMLSFTNQGSALTAGNINFTTLPIVRFGTDPAGEDINIVDVPAIQTLVRNLIGEHTPPPTAPPSTSTRNRATTKGAASATVDVVNATNRHGLAARLERTLAGTGFTPGVTSTVRHYRPTTMIYYPGPDSVEAANALAEILGDPPRAPDSTLPSGHLRVVLGADYTDPTALGTATPPAGDDPSPTTAIAHHGTETAGPPALPGDGIPCVN